MHHSFQNFILFVTVVMIVVDIFGFDWNSIEERNKVDNVVKMHRNFAGLCVPLVYFWQIIIPMTKSALDSLIDP